KRSAELARPTLEALLDSADLVFVIAGLGGGAGTGSVSVIAQIAMEQGAITVGIVSYPLQTEVGRPHIADVGIKSLISSSHSVIVLDNNRLMDLNTDMPINQVFSIMDQIIGEAVKGISELINEPMLINIDYADVRAIMSKGGISVMFVGESKQQNRVDSVVRECLSNPMIEIDYRGATGCLIHISGGSDLSLQEAEEIATSFTYALDPHADVIWGARVRKDMEGKIRVFAIMTGVRSRFDEARPVKTDRNTT
ncbi:MAG: cell division protein FtsZ, partial [Methanomicrobiales archaeon]|nr:cell division protein FtsZ [Methanomicrobiales archaeon]